MPRRGKRARSEPDVGLERRSEPADLAEAGPDDTPDADRGPGLTQAAALDLLRTGELDVQGRLIEASNLDLYCTITRHCPDPEPDVVAACVYKPIRGERPLDDFPDGTLAYREVAAHVVSEATGWAIVPPTIMREGPLGLGMVQLWIDVDETIDVVALIRAGHPGLRRMAVFDAIVNNADRKGGHMLPTSDGHIFGVDHGICFSPDPKLRTILWGWRGTAFNDEEIAVLRRLGHELRGPLAPALSRLLAPEEVAATARRVATLLRRGTFPQPDPTRPAIPWPPF
jgi:uncharacterized repeat protein (TIGR03843 family)